MTKSRIYLIITLFLCIFTSCSQIEDFDKQIADKNSCTMQLEGGIILFDSKSNTTRATTSEWRDGEKLYVVFTAASGTTNGVAIYNMNTKSWNVTFESALVKDKAAKCKVYYFEDKEIPSEVTALEATDIVYGDEDATYYFPAGDALVITANIKPLTSRIRFKGTAGTELTITGITYFCTYSQSSGLQPLKQNSVITTTIQSNGYTPYIYGVFESSIAPGMSLAYNNQSFTADCTGLSILKIGKSGWMNVPTMTSHNGWIANALGGTIGGHDYVDLGLPSGTLWATCNIGANTPEDFGDYFSWGETAGYKSGKVNFDEAHYKYYNGNEHQITKYCTDSNYGYNGFTDGKTELELMDDAAYVNWGTEWRMPTNTQLYELLTQTTAVFSDVNGVKGYKMVGNNAQFIFLPAASYYWGDILIRGLNDGSYPGCYWSRNSTNSYGGTLCDANCLVFNEFEFYWSDYSCKNLLNEERRQYGASVRAVKND